jgi:hypothetical protein
MQVPHNLLQTAERKIFSISLSSPASKMTFNLRDANDFIFAFLDLMALAV